ncbi:hypothetical protein [Haloactinomyces albus]|uniref:Uncharacterized protein n=1 Tax=Haloactinomyces albus TaxID=1352928 RepID=A0AAE3ZIW5_9ACTN|nr:hypothetical protein [Haloactinomyces albus]MDR7304490.1 hypothetical protein [Haloactinomyces albus]
MPTAARVLIVVLIPDQHPPGGLWHVATAWSAHRRQRRAYATSHEEECHHDESGS